MKGSRWCLFGLLGLVGVIAFWLLASGWLMILWPHQYGRFLILMKHPLDIAEHSHDNSNDKHDSR